MHRSVGKTQRFGVMASAVITAGALMVGMLGSPAFAATDPASEAPVTEGIENLDEPVTDVIDEPVEELIDEPAEELVEEPGNEPSPEATEEPAVGEEIIAETGSAVDSTLPEDPSISDGPSEVELVDSDFPETASANATPAATVVSLINKQRAQAKLPAYANDAALTKAAQEWANELAKTGKHTTSSAEWRKTRTSGAGWAETSESLSYGYTNGTPWNPTQLFNAIAPKKQHKDLILSKEATGVGVGWAQIKRGSFTYSYEVIVYGVAKPAIPAGTKVTINGTAKAGSPLTVAVTGIPAKAKLASVQWKVDGKNIAGATKGTFVPRVSQSGKKITVSATLTSDVYRPSTITSAVKTVAKIGTKRLQGPDRYATSLDVARNNWQAGSKTVYMASGLSYPDSLSAVAVASALESPLLLTEPNKLSSGAAVLLKEKNVTKVVIVGGESVVKPAVATQLKNIGITVERQAGKTRYETSLKLIKASFPEAKSVYIATGQNFPDALASAAAAGASKRPVLLVDGRAKGLNAESSAILRAIGAKNLYLVGGQNTVSAGIETSLKAAKYSVGRLAGKDRYETAAKLNAEAYKTVPNGWVAAGGTFPDALSAGAAAGAAKQPLYLAMPNCLPNYTDDGLTSRQVSSLTLVGGTKSLGAGVAGLVRCP